MRHTDSTDPDCLYSVEDMIRLIEKVGFLPLFSNSLPGFSVEEHTLAGSWWTGNPESDPWEWRCIASQDDRVAYGKFFDKKAGYVSKEWFPVFANYRRDGYDFDALYDDELAPYRHKLIMDQFTDGRTWLSPDLKKAAGFGKGGEKNFPGVITDLQMQTYLIAGGFRRRKSKKGAEYGMAATVLTMPETKWGYDFVASGYSENVGESRQRLFDQALTFFPDSNEKDLRRLLGIRHSSEP